MDLLEKRLSEHSSAECPIELIRGYLKQIVEVMSRNCAETDCPVFADKYPVLFRMLTASTDVSILDTFLDKLSQIQEGKEDLKEAEKNLAKTLNEKYVTPALKEKGL